MKCRKSGDLLSAIAGKATSNWFYRSIQSFLQVLLCRRVCLQPFIRAFPDKRLFLQEEYL